MAVGGKRDTEDKWKRGDNRREVGGSLEKDVVHKQTEERERQRDRDREIDRERQKQRDNIGRRSDVDKAKANDRNQPTSTVTRSDQTDEISTAIFQFRTDIDVSDMSAVDIEVRRRDYPLLSPHSPLPSAFYLLTHSSPLYIH